MIMANDQASTTAPLPVKRYVARQTISVRECGIKFSERATVSSSDFFSAYDPKQTLFYLALRFGSGEADHFSAYVHTRLVQTTITRMKFEVFNDKGVKLGESKLAEQRVITPKSGRGFPKILKADDLKTENAVNVLFEMEYESASLPLESSSSSQRSLLQDDFAKLFENASLADCAFIVQGEKIMAHKAVIAARCSYFQGIFQSRMKESTSGEIEVPDFTPQVFKELLKYLYSGCRPDCSVEDLMGLTVAADKYGVDELKKMCESVLSTRLSSENVIEVLLLADLHNCPVLMEHAIVVFKMHMGELKKESWFKLGTNPDLLPKLFNSFMP